MTTKRVRFEDIKMQRGKTDWNYLKREDARQYVDLDAPEINSAQLSQMKKPKKLNK